MRHPLMGTATLLNISIAVAATLLTAAIIYLSRNMFGITRGKRIAAYAKPARALLVMDIQESSGNRVARSEQPPIDTPFGMMLHNVNSLIDGFALAGDEVAYIRQVFKSDFLTRLHGGRIVAGRLQPRICRWVRLVNGNDFVKQRTDAFSCRELENFLIERQVNEIFLVGLDAAFCVYYTALGGLQRGYRVTVITDAVMTGRSWRKVLARYRAKGIAIMNSTEVLRHISDHSRQVN